MMTRASVCTRSCWGSTVEFMMLAEEAVEEDLKMPKRRLRRLLTV